MNEEELKKEIEKWSKGCNVNIDFPKGLKYCDGINLCKVCKINLDLYKAELKGFQKGKLEERERIEKIIDKFMKERIYIKSSDEGTNVSIIKFMPFELEQLQKEIGGMK